MLRSLNKLDKSCSPFFKIENLEKIIIFRIIASILNDIVLKIRLKFQLKLQWGRFLESKCAFFHKIRNRDDFLKSLKKSNDYNLQLCSKNKIYKELVSTENATTVITSSF